MKAIDTLEPEFKQNILLLLEVLKEHGIDCVVTSGRRTIDAQNKLYAQGRTSPGRIVTNAKGGESAHNFGMAADLCPIRPVTHDLWWDAPDDIWNVIHLYGEEAGLRSGYDFTTIKDSPHLEAGNWKFAQALWKAGKLDVK